VEDAENRIAGEPLASTSLPICSATRRPNDAYVFGVGSAVSAFTAMACQ
jgi:hypothetical protein